MKRLAMVALATSGCAHAPQLSEPAQVAELTPALRPLAWWLGTWRATDGVPGSETWLANAGALYGIALHDDGTYELRIVDDAVGGKRDGMLHLFAMPQHRPFGELHSIGAVAGTRVELHADSPPLAIAYVRDGDRLTASLTGDRDAHFVRAPLIARAPELEAADRAFDAATAARGAEGWTAAFDADGAMGRASGRVAGADAIRAQMQPLLANGALRWAPFASGRSGDVGFTVGKATYEPASHLPADRWRSTYATIWHRQPDGSWKVLFDAGRAIDE